MHATVVQCCSVGDCLEAVDVNDDSMSLQNIMQGKD
jgi:hypothetical protein